MKFNSRFRILYKGHGATDTIIWFHEVFKTAPVDWLLLCTVIDVTFMVSLRRIRRSDGSTFHSYKWDARYELQRVIYAVTAAVVNLTCRESSR